MLVLPSSACFDLSLYKVGHHGRLRVIVGLACTCDTQSHLAFALSLRKCRPLVERWYVNFQSHDYSLPSNSAGFAAICFWNKVRVLGFPSFVAVSFRFILPW